MLKCANCGQKIECRVPVCGKDPSVIVTWIDGSWGFYCDDHVPRDELRVADIKSVTRIDEAFPWPPVVIP